MEILFILMLGYGAWWLSKNTPVSGELKMQVAPDGTTRTVGKGSETNEVIEIGEYVRLTHKSATGLTEGYVYGYTPDGSFLLVPEPPADWDDIYGDGEPDIHVSRRRSANPHAKGVQER